jgi:type IV pilus biogenesis protein CpaD/CtpE
VPLSDNEAVIRLSLVVNIARSSYSAAHQNFEQLIDNTKAKVNDKNFGEKNVR